MDKSKYQKCFIAFILYSSYALWLWHFEYRSISEERQLVIVPAKFLRATYSPATAEAVLDTSDSNTYTQECFYRYSIHIPAMKSSDNSGNGNGNGDKNEGMLPPEKVIQVERKMDLAFCSGARLHFMNETSYAYWRQNGDFSGTILFTIPWHIWAHLQLVLLVLLGGKMIDYMCRQFDPPPRLHSVHYETDQDETHSYASCLRFMRPVLAYKYAAIITRKTLLIWGILIPFTLILIAETNIVFYLMRAHIVIFASIMSIFFGAKYMGIFACCSSSSSSSFRRYLWSEEDQAARHNMKMSALLVYLIACTIIIFFWAIYAFILPVAPTLSSSYEVLKHMMILEMISLGVILPFAPTCLIVASLNRYKEINTELT